MLHSEASRKTADETTTCSPCSPAFPEDGGRIFSTRKAAKQSGAHPAVMLASLQVTYLYQRQWGGQPGILGDQKKKYNLLLAMSCELSIHCSPRAGGPMPHPEEVFRFFCALHRFFPIWATSTRDGWGYVLRILYLLTQPDPNGHNFITSAS